MVISEPFAKVLAAGRPQFNQRVTEARRRYPAFDTAAFADFLQNGVDDVVRAVHQIAPDRIASTALVAYDIALELIGQALAGPRARNKLVNQVCIELIPAYARLLASNPLEVLGTLSNAAVNISKVANARPAQWLHEMKRLAPQVESLGQLQSLGQILAWRAGVAHFRLGAIEAADQLPQALALTAIGTTTANQWAEVRSKLLANPWWAPEQTSINSPKIGIEIGQFTGFGGDFIEPPEVRACPEGFFVKSGTRLSLLIADSFGAVLHSATQEEFEHAKTHQFARAITLNGTRLTIGGRQIDLDLFANHITAACNAHTVAVTSPFTHVIRLFPLQ